MSEIKEQPRARHPAGRVALVSWGAVAAIYGVGYLTGDHVSTTPEISYALQQKLQPVAERLAKMTLQVNYARDGHMVVTKPDSDSAGDPEENVSMDAWAGGEWIHIEASMFRNNKGQLDPTTTNEVDIWERACGPNVCGGHGHLAQEVDIIFGDNTTFTKGNWGVESDFYPPGYKDPTITLNTATKNSNELATKPDAKEALSVAKVWANAAKALMDEVLSSKDIRVPELKGAQTT